MTCSAAMTLPWFAKHLESRFTRGVVDEYEVEVVRPGDGVRVPIRCSAMPETNDRGEVVGAIAIVRDLLAEDVSAKVHKAVEDMRDSRGILQAVAKECERVVPFDMFGVTLYSADGEHAQTFYHYPEGQFRPSVRWYEMSSYAKALVNAKQVVNVPDFEEWLDRPEWRQYRDEPDTQQYSEDGTPFERVVPGHQRQPRGRDGRLRSEAGQDPVRQAGRGTARPPAPRRGRCAWPCTTRRSTSSQFALKLIRKIASGSASTEFIAATLIEEIAKQYEWENVSIFRPDEQEGQLWLVRQKAQKESFLLPDGWHHPIDKGVTGRVYRTATALNVSDVTAPEFRDLYLAVYAESRSELCIPILVDGRVYWVLNLEDSKRNAFAKEEQEALENILREVAVVLELVSKTQIFTELLKRSKDSVIQTDFRGTIVQTNPATEELLGYTEAEMKGAALATYFKDKDQARRVQEASKLRPQRRGAPGPKGRFGSQRAALRDVAAARDRSQGLRLQRSFRRASAWRRSRSCVRCTTRSRARSRRRCPWPSPGSANCGRSRSRRAPRTCSTRRRSSFTRSI